MIRSFKDRATEAAFNGEGVKGFPADLLKVARRKLAMVNAAASLDDLRSPPGNQLHKLDRDRAGQFAIRINDQFRVCFKWKDGDAFDVEIADYH